MDLLRYVSILVAHPEFSVFFPLSPDLKLRPYWKKVWKASWVSFFLMIRGKKCLSIFIFPLRLLWSEEESPAPRLIWTCDSAQFRALVEESVLLLFPHECIPLFCPLHWKEPIGLFSSAHILMPWLTEPSRRKCKWATWAYVQDSLLKPRGGIYFQSNLLVAPAEADE